MIVKFMDRLGNLVKSITSIAYIPIDTEPVDGSKHLITSGAAAEMMASIDKMKWTRRTETVDVPGGGSKQLDIQEHEFVALNATHSGSNTDGTLTLHLQGECYVRLDKAARTKVLPLVGDAQPTSVINTGMAYLDKNEEYVLQAGGCGLSEQYDPNDFSTVGVLSNDTSLGTSQPNPSSISPCLVLLHSLGEGTIIVTPIPA